MIHPETTCNFCKSAPITGVRYMSILHSSFNLCESCEKNGSYQYPLLKICDPKFDPIFVDIRFREDIRVPDEIDSFKEHQVFTDNDISYKEGDAARDNIHFSKLVTDRPLHNQNGTSLHRPQVLPPHPHDYHHHPSHHNHHPRPPRPNDHHHHPPHHSHHHHHPLHHSHHHHPPRGLHAFHHHHPAVQNHPRPRFENSFASKVKSLNISDSAIDSTDIKVQKNPNRIPKPALRFLRHSSYPDGSIIRIATPFTKTWCIRNDGNKQWPEGVVFRPSGGDPLCDSDYSIPLPCLDADGELEISVTLKSPSKCGLYTQYFRAQTRDDQLFGHRLWVSIMVVE